MTNALSRALGLSLAGLLAAGSVAAQSNQENPHDVISKDKPAQSGRATDVERRGAEAGDPNSVDNNESKGAPVASDKDNSHSREAFEINNPNSTLNKDREVAAPAAVIARLHAANLAEIEDATLAVDKGSSRVQEYGRMLIKEHQLADEKLTALAGKLLITPSDDPTDKRARSRKTDAGKTREKLRAMSGAGFDRAFSRELERDHHQDLAMVREARRLCHEPALCAFLDETLPVLQAHERSARALREPPAQGRSAH